ncbi:hypothetical protein [Janthinobacterium sp.]|uniref:hypothetical protein n=1 Tax=Janthinobacterium sp. TaxID=1871054 RepID=UPI00293D6593|nr:hypothetical protein [Janthinobacterium sp.]
MNKSTWSGIIGAGLLATASGFGTLGALGAESAGAPAAPLLAALLLTSGLAACLGGLLGLSGVMAWIPGLAEPGAARRRPE